MNVKDTYITLKSGEKVFAWYALPQDLPKATICFCHGWGEHSLKYKEWAQRFVDGGYAFMGWDHVGHGLSEGKRGYMKDYSVFMEEIKLIIQKAHTINPAAPVVLYGHSMGGNFIINYALRETNTAKLLIATSPWVQLAKKHPPMLNLTIKILNKVAPGVQFKAPINIETISASEEEVIKKQEDTLSHGTITPKLITQVDDAGQYAMENMDKLGRPLLLIHGDNDPITSFEASLELCRKNESCNFLTVHDNYHELHTGPTQDFLFETITQWLNENLINSKANNNGESL